MPTPDTGIKAALESGASRLAAAGVPTPEVDAALLLAHVLGLGRGELAAKSVAGAAVDAVARTAYDAALDRRAAREPLQHITGVAHFRHLTLAVGPGVFVPRPETELLAQLAIDALLAVPDPRPIGVDLGTGSGAIAIAMAREVPHARVVAVERSADAMGWAQQNARTSGATNLELVHGDLRDGLPELDGRVHVVASNPPYIPLGAIPRDPEVHHYDPALALYGGDDGLDLVRALAVTAARLLVPGGLLGIEHGESQATGVQDILATDHWRAIATHRDLTTRPRVTTALRA